MEALREIMANAETREAYLAQLNGGLKEGEKGEKGEEGEEDQKEGAGAAAAGGGVVDLLAGETDCPVCLDEFGNESIVNCVTCRKPTHQNCFNIWNGNRRQKTCAETEPHAAPGKQTNKETKTQQWLSLEGLFFFFVRLGGPEQTMI